MTTRRRRHTLAIAAAALKGFHTGLAGGSLSDNYFIATNQRTAWIFGFEDGVKQRALSDGWEWVGKSDGHPMVIGVVAGDLPSPVSDLPAMGETETTPAEETTKQFE